MSRIVFLVASSQREIIARTLVEMDFVEIDMAKVRRRYPGSYRSAEIDKFICKTFAKQLRLVSEKSADIVVNCYPRTARQVQALHQMRLFSKGFKPVFVVSSATPREAMRTLMRHFPWEVTRKKITVPP